ncbi:4-hydroxybenzoate 3-monooxygenase [Actinosynnema sp. NPDC047251]|uniref:p-hydroxybenzoate hydroxylase n=1 Tax=Saccharothrix espanaensis (strain ATCC 51144 / DSM 44229 / JCM 9112 / NBRC 15066 / NRRL 15764) TaxID=1179773 RepID=K0K2L5_SACES|nr:4-hydroxybenzoate 3-monooxygenase [Saccharothrix espanaensis]CCH30803.1 p-hydroxybenzoate hydroxylase [Saccharothrix espanaensis DSM 44229]
MDGARERTTVVVVGAGVAGLTVANLVHRNGIGCVVLERHDRAHVEGRQRAGVIDHAAEQVYLRAGLDDLLAGARRSGTLEFRVDGVPRRFDAAAHADGRVGRLIPQQLLVRRLISTFVDGGGDLRFAAHDVALHDIDGDRPHVTYRDADGVPRRLDADFLAGCDGFHGVSRASIPPDALTTYRHADEVGWFTVLTDSPPPALPLLALSPHGFAAHFGRGPAAGRFYLQCRPGEDLAAWTDDRVWRQLRLRLADEDLVAGPIVAKAVIDARSFVVDPMAHGRLFLVGDAAHIVPPLGGKGMNLAIADAGVLARALSAAVHDDDPGPLREYSATCLRRVWHDQEFSRWLGEVVFHGSDPATAGPFRWRLARARLDRLFTSPAAARAFAESTAGPT